MLFGRSRKGKRNDLTIWLQWSGNGVRREKQPTMNDELIAGWQVDGVATDVPKAATLLPHHTSLPHRVGPTSSAF